MKENLTASLSGALFTIIKQKQTGINMEKFDNKRKVTCENYSNTSKYLLRLKSATQQAMPRLPKAGLQQIVCIVMLALVALKSMGPGYNSCRDI